MSGYKHPLNVFKKIVNQNPAYLKDGKQAQTADFYW